MINLYKLIKAYKFSFAKILFYELFYILIGYKGNSFSSSANKSATDNIPCPYFFLVKIVKFIKQNNVNSLIDLGCGSGRSIYFFNKNFKINYFGIEYFDDIYFKCRKLFEKNNNVAIINDNFMNHDFFKFNNDCFFINDPLWDINDFNILIHKIINHKNNLNRKIFLILVNINDNKLRCLKNYKLLEQLKINSRGYYIFSNIKINEAKN